jgi:hypothetical protein
MSKKGENTLSQKILKLIFPTISFSYILAPTIIENMY